MESSAVLILINFAVCLAGGILCICRMTKMNHRETKLLIRWQYVIWFTALFASGWSFIFGAPPNGPQIGMGIVICGYLICGIPAWKRGAPLYTRRGVLE